MKENLQQAFWQDVTFILVSLLITAILFYLAGRYCRKCKNSKKEDNDWYAELEECKRKYNQLLVKNSGGKLDIESITKPEIKEVERLLHNISDEKETKPEMQTISQHQSNLEIKTQQDSKAVDIEALKAKLGISSQTQSKAIQTEEQLKKQSENNYSDENLKLFFGTTYKYDDLKIVEGIGPKIASILNNNGINTWKQLSETNPEIIREWLLEIGGASYKIHEPATWPQQAKLAFEGKFEALKELQDNLKGGKA